MEIISESSLNDLDKLTNNDVNAISESPDATVTPTIRDVGDVGVKTGINF